MSFLNTTRFSRVFIFAVFALAGLTTQAQINAVSPLTIFGFGDVSEGYFAQNYGLGGSAIALREPLFINFANPASFSALEYATLETAISQRFIKQSIESNGQTINNTSTYFNYFSLGFKLKDWWGTGIAVMPFTFVGYNIATYDSLADFGSILYKFEGSGGLNQAVWGNGFEPIKNLSIGFNARYIFGNVDKSEAVLFNDPRFYNAKRLSKTTVSAFNLDYGIQYTIPLRNNFDLNFGATYATSVNMNAKLTSLKYTYLVNSTGGEFPVDTIDAVIEEGGHITLPSRFGAAFSFGKKNENAVNYAWMVTAEVNTTQWTQYSGFDGQGGLNDALRANAGMYFTPQYAFAASRKSKSYFSKIEYRFGGFYEKTQISLENKDVLNYGATLGFGLPVGYKNLAPGEKKSTVLNFGIVLGNKGNGLPNQINEQYINLLFGITLGDQWFQKFKYR